tara:strand:- start:6237 stop:6635 length:399 start_codon:yes stop_codon:yes gene_type:complete
LNNKESILIVEDSAPNRKILEHLVKKMGFNPIVCNDGLEAKEKIESNIPNLVAIISDIMMPNMDGISLLSYVRKNSDQKIPFLMCTAILDRDYVLESKKLGVDGYIVKPVSYNKIKERLSHVLPNREWPKNS